MHHRAPIYVAVILAIIACVPSRGAAQQNPGWDIESELSGSIFFGNTRQTLVTTRATVGHADSSYLLSSTARFTYGEATNDEEATFVSRRSWSGSMNLDYMPYDLLSPFVLTTVESSLEARIDLRMSGGAGAKLSLVRQETRKLDFSLAVLGERTFLPTPLGDTTQTLLRWSARLRFARELGERIRLSHETSYMPVVDDAGSFTMKSSTSLAYRLASFASLNLSFLDNFDSEAERRGARSNNDGQFVVGIVANF
jgi:hypothetical protein